MQLSLPIRLICSNLKSSDQTITTLDLNYSYGFSILNTHIYSGASIVVTNKSLLEKEFWSLYKNNRITNISGVPTIYYILKRLKFLEKYLKNIKFLTAAGGKLDLDTLLYFTKKINKKKKIFIICMVKPKLRLECHLLRTKT